MKDWVFEILTNVVALLSGGFFGHLIAKKKADADIFRQMQDGYQSFIKHEREQFEELKLKYEQLKIKVEELQQMVNDLMEQLAKEKTEHNRLKREFEKYKKDGKAT